MERPRNHRLLGGNGQQQVTGAMRRSNGFGRLVTCTTPPLDTREPTGWAAGSTSGIGADADHSRSRTASCGCPGSAVAVAAAVAPIVASSLLGPRCTQAGLGGVTASALDANCSRASTCTAACRGSDVPVRASSRRPGGSLDAASSAVSARYAETDEPPPTTTTSSDDLMRAVGAIASSVRLRLRGGGEACSVGAAQDPRSVRRSARRAFRGRPGGCCGCNAPPAVLPSRAGAEVRCPSLARSSEPAEMSRNALDSSKRSAVMSSPAASVSPQCTTACDPSGRWRTAWRFGDRVGRARASQAPCTRALRSHLELRQQLRDGNWWLNEARRRCAVPRYIHLHRCGHVCRSYRTVVCGGVSVGRSAGARPHNRTKPRPDRGQPTCRT